MWELDCEENWVPKNWCFWSMVLEKTLESPWTARRCNQSILKEISPRCSLEGLMLKLKLQYFGHLMWRVDSLEKILMLGGIGAGGERDDGGWDGWMASPTRWTWVWVDSGSWWWTERLGMLRFMGLQRVGHDWVTELNWVVSRWWKMPSLVYSGLLSGFSNWSILSHWDSWKFNRCIWFENWIALWDYVIHSLSHLDLFYRLSLGP